MLTAQRKGFILAKAGIDVPLFPGQHKPHGAGPSDRGHLSTLQEREDDAEQARAVTRWNREVAVLFAIYATARAAKSLRDAEEAQQMDRLRRANA